MKPDDRLNPKMRDFIHAEQALNNHLIYSDDYAKEHFHTTVPFYYQPMGQRWFRLPYWLIPEGSPWALSAGSSEHRDFLEATVWESENGQAHYRFFLHPLTVDRFREWVGDGLAFISGEESAFWATPTSSYRSLLVIRERETEPFIAKVTLFTNLTRGSRHIDWYSALGQWEHSRIMEVCKSQEDPVEQLHDVAALGLVLPVPIDLPEELMITIGPRRISRFGTVIRRLPPPVVRGERGLISFASLTSPLRFGGSLIVEMAEKAGLPYWDFVQAKVIQPLLETLHSWILDKGFLIEPHCQNVLAEMDTLGNLTGRFYYRDFDRMHLDRDVFPQRFPDLWQAYIQDRPDRITLEEEQEARYGTLQVYFHHFLQSLCRTLLRAGLLYQKVSEPEMEKQWQALVRQVKVRLFQEYPEADPDFLLDLSNLEYVADTLGRRESLMLIKQPTLWG